MQITCDCCKTEIHPQPEKLRDGKIEHVFFRCPECGEVYWVSVTDQKLRDSIAEYERMRMMIKARPQSERFHRRAVRIKENNMKRCRELMEQYPLAPLLQPVAAE